MTSISGYSKKELYREFENVFFTSKDKNKAFYLAVEIVCSRNEVNHFLIFILNLFLNNIKLNTEIIDILSNQFHKIKHLQEKPKILHQKSFQVIICEIVFLLFSNSNSNNHEKYITKNKKKFFDPEIAYDDEIIAKYDGYVQKYSHCMTESTFRNLCIMLHALHKNDKEMYEKVIYELLFSPQAKFNAQITDFDFKYVNNLDKKTKNDVFWLIWKIILDYAKNQGQPYPFVKELFLLALFNYTRRHRVVRSLLLHYAFLGINQKYYESESPKGLDNVNPKKINYVFEEILSSTKK